MKEELLIALLNFAVRFGIDAASAFIKRAGTSPTIDDAIAALDMAAAKTLAQYKAEAPAPAPVP